MGKHALHGIQNSYCNLAWELMRGSEKIRYCPICRSTVYRIDTMDEQEVANLFATEKQDTPLLYRREDGTVTLKPGRCGTLVRDSKLDWLAVGAFAVLLTALGSLFLTRLLIASLIVSILFNVLFRIKPCVRIADLKSSSFLHFVLTALLWAGLLALKASEPIDRLLSQFGIFIVGAFVVAQAFLESSNAINFARISAGLPTLTAQSQTKIKRI